MTYLKAKCITCGKKREKLGTFEKYQCNSCIETINIKLDATRSFSYIRTRTYELPVIFSGTINAIEDHVLRINIDTVTKINLQHHVSKFIQRNHIIRANAFNCIFLEHEIVAVMSKDFYALDDNFDEYELQHKMFQSPTPLDFAGKIFITGPITRSFVTLGIGAIKIRNE